MAFGASGFTYNKWFATRKQLFESKGNLARVTIMADGAAAALMGKVSQADRNAMMRSALMVAGRFWVEVFLPKRFTDYAIRLGYRPSADWVAFKQRTTGQAIPLVEFGVTRAAALNGARVSAVATASKSQVKIGIPLGHPVQKNTARFIHRIPPWELQRIVEVGGKALHDIVTGQFAESDNGKPDVRAPIPIASRGKAVVVARVPAHRPRRSA